jgi:acetamidase/formamidase
MCRGDDPSCSEFELHHRQFVEDMARERRAFLASRFAAKGGAATLAAGGLALPKRISPATRHHHLPANADTVHWGYFSKNLKPQLDVESGDFVTIETLTHQASDDHERMIEGDPGAESVYLWTKDRKGVARRGAGEGDGKGLGVHICTGPVLVHGAERGDVLEVRIVDVTLRPSANPKFRGLAFGSNAAANWGFHYTDFLTGETREVVTIYELDATGERNWARAVYNFRWPEVTDPFGVKHPTIDYPGLPVDHALTARNWDVLKGVRVPVRPHFGVMGLAPKEADDVNSVPPSYTGGNIDNWRIGKGASVYYPVAVPGALLSVGDPHASQGDSELCGTPIEGLDFPMIETEGEWVLQGFSFPNYLADLGAEAQSEIFRKSSVDLAMRDAFRKMRRFLMTAKGLTEDEAISLMSIAVDFGITQVVDGNWGVHAIVRKDIFPA